MDEISKRFYRKLFLIIAFLILIILFFLLFASVFLRFSGYHWYIPKIFVCEDPFIYYLDADIHGAERGIMNLDGKEQEFFVTYENRAYCFWKKEHFSHYFNGDSGDISVCEDELLFKGYCNSLLSNEDAEIKIICDNTGHFSEGETVRFIRYEKEEYLKKHGILKLAG